MRSTHWRGDGASGVGEVMDDANARARHKLTLEGDRGTSMRA
jgi:hypothetical protein